MAVGVVVAALCMANAAWGGGKGSGPTPVTADTAFQVRYAANLDRGESFIDIINTGANGASLTGPGIGNAIGNICVNVYGFTADEEMVSCCSCLVTPNQVIHLGVVADILGNLTHTGAPASLTLKLLATGAGGSAGTGTSCTNSAANVAASTTAIVNGLVAFGTTLHAAPNAGLAVTETPFIPATLGTGELASLGARCTAIIGGLSGFGICGVTANTATNGQCNLGALGAAKI